MATLTRLVLTLGLLGVLWVANSASQVGTGPVIGGPRLPGGCSNGQGATYSTTTGAWGCASLSSSFSTSAALAALLSDEVGSAGGGEAVFNESPTIVTPTVAAFATASTFPAGTGTETLKACGVIEATTTNAATGADTNETDLWSYTLPANTLAVDGSFVRVTVWVSFAANANAKTVRHYFGGTSIHSFAGAFNNVQYHGQTQIIRKSASDESVGTEAQAGTTGGTSYNNGPGVSLTANAIIKVTGQNGSASASDITFRGATVEVCGL